MFSITHKLQQLNMFELILVNAMIEALRMPFGIGKPIAYGLMGFAYVYGTVKRVIA